MREPGPAPEPLPLPVADSHCHLDIVESATGLPVAEQLAAARTAGVAGVLQVGVDLASSRRAVQIARTHPGVRAAVALHPNEAGAGAATAQALEQVAALALDPVVTTVGETGLDHFRTGPEGHRLQEEAFRAHIAIAKATGRALVVHDRDAHDDVVRVLLSEGPPERVVFHCFSGGPQLARTCAEHGWAMSFAGPLTYKPNDALREAARLAPPELLLAETDAPFLPAVPHRGRANTCAHVTLTVRALAQVRGQDLEQVCDGVCRAAEHFVGPFWPHVSTPT